MNVTPGSRHTIHQRVKMISTTDKRYDIQIIFACQQTKKRVWHFHHLNKPDKFCGSFKTVGIA